MIGAFNEYPQLKELKDIEFHVPAKDEWQVDKECGCMVVLRYWQAVISQRKAS